MYFITNYQHLWMLMLIEIALKVFLCHVNVYLYLGKYIYFLILYIFHVLICIESYFSSVFLEINKAGIEKFAINADFRM